MTGEAPRTEAEQALAEYFMGHGRVPAMRKQAAEARAAQVVREAAAAPPEPHGTHTPCCGWPSEHKWADPIRCMKCHEDWPCAAARAAAPEGLSLDVLEAAIRAAFEEDGAHFGKRNSPDEYRVLAHYVKRRLSPSSGESVHSDDCYGKTGLSACRCGASSGESGSPTPGDER